MQAESQDETRVLVAGDTDDPTLDASRRRYPDSRNWDESEDDPRRQWSFMGPLYGSIVSVSSHQFGANVVVGMMFETPDGHIYTGSMVAHRRTDYEDIRDEARKDPDHVETYEQYVRRTHERGEDPN
jgi:hypothetical protein